MSVEDDIEKLLDGSSRKKRRASATARTPAAKRRKAFNGSSNDFESEEDDGNPFPLDGRYKNERDRLDLMELNELEREEILAQRLEEQQKHRDKVNLAMLHKQSTGQAVDDDDDDDEPISGKRTIPPSGAKKDKANKLKELKEKRKERATKAAKAKPEVTKSRAPSDSEGSDMSLSDDDEEGQVSKFSEDEAVRSRSSPQKPAEEKLEKDDLEKVRLTRDQITKWCTAPFFKEFITGAWVRYMVGNDNNDGRPVYRVCEITGLGPETSKTYKIDNIVFNQAVELKHGSAVKLFNMDRISNSPFTDREFDRVVATFDIEKLKMPTKAALQRKADEIEKFSQHVLTNSDINAMVARKSQLSAKPSMQAQFAEKSRLHQERALAVRRQDQAEIDRIDALIAASVGPTRLDTPTPDSKNGKLDIMEQLAKVNERNRKSNKELIRIAEAAEAEERRKQRAGEGGLKPPVARKIISRGNTPLLGPQQSNGDSMPPLTLTGDGSAPGSAANSLPTSPAPSRSVSRFEVTIASAVDVDLGDF